MQIHFKYCAINVSDSIIEKLSITQELLFQCKIIVVQVVMFECGNFGNWLILNDLACFDFVILKFLLYKKEQICGLVFFFASYFGSRKQKTNVKARIKQQCFMNISTFTVCKCNIIWIKCERLFTENMKKINNLWCYIDKKLISMIGSINNW